MFFGGGRDSRIPASKQGTRSGYCQPPPARAAVKDSSPAGCTIENTRDVPASAPVTRDALVDDVGEWWPADPTWWGDASRLSIKARARGYSPDDLSKCAPGVDRTKAAQLGGLAKLLSDRGASMPEENRLKIARTPAGSAIALAASSTAECDRPGCA